MQTFLIIAFVLGFFATFTTGVVYTAGALIFKSIGRKPYQTSKRINRERKFYEMFGLLFKLSFVLLIGSIIGVVLYSAWLSL